ncbi:MAG: molybdenum cofactor guanylyltransferase [Gammaproteobacteria bacterium]|nr:molybdenum cofactor guanylyltransferase [Gammaproteobacteria bacterium]
MAQSDTKISCIILAGGEGKRVGGVDKGLLEYKDKPLIEHMINILAPQVEEIVISANRNIERYKSYTSKVIADESEHYRGPMAGIAAALPHCNHDWVLIVACDTPFLPANIVDTLLQGHNDSYLHIAEADDKLQLVMLLHRTLHPSLQKSLDENQLRLMQWAKSQQPEIINFQDSALFKNFNNDTDFGT